MLQWIEKVLTDGQWWENIGLIALKILIILIFAQLIIRISNIAFKKIVSRDYNGSFMSDERRIKTLSTLFNNVIKYVVHFVTIMLVLAQMNFDLAPLIASAGVLGLAIGFGAQNLVKDVVNGFFIIFEDQFAVGDQVTIGNFSGTVVQIGLRITKIKSYTGEIHIITNGAITEVTNFSVNNAIAVVDISVAYEENSDRVIKELNDLFKEQIEIEHLMSAPKVLGIQALTVGEMIIRVIAECKANMNVPVTRELRKLIKNRLDEKGIITPHFPHPNIRRA